MAKLTFCEKHSSSNAIENQSKKNSSLQGCRYPYNTPQARMERRIQQDLKQKTSDEKRMAALNKGMDSNLIAKTPDSLSAIPDSIKP